MTDFESLVNLYRLVDFSPSSKEGSLLIKDQEQVSLLQKILDNKYNYNVHLASDSYIIVGETIQLSFSYPRIGLGIIAYDIQEFLETRTACFKEPTNYYIIKDNYYNQEKNPHIPKDLVSYYNVIRFIRLLGKAASYFDETSGCLIFYNNEKLEIHIDYTLEDLQLLDKDSLNNLFQYYKGGIHEEEKLTILANSIQEIYPDEYKNNNQGKFSFLLSNLSILFQHFKAGYNLFASSFSYEKIKNETEQFKIEEVTKIHKTFSDIQTQILGIPVATIISATQMKPIINSTYQYYINLLILIGCFTFSVLCGFFIYNQWITLNVIEKEIKRKEQQVSDEFKVIIEYISPAYDELKKRVFWQRLILISLSIILFVTFIFSFIIFLSS